MSEAPAWWEGFFPELFARIQGDSRDRQRSEDEAARVQALLELPDRGAVLDVPCGEGRHALALARRGYRVTGVELHAGTLAVARAAAEDQGLEVRLDQSDMRELPYREEFDGAYCFWSSFGYFEDAENARFLAAVFATLRPGAGFLIEGHTLETLLPRMEARSWSRVGEAVLLEERHYDHDRGRIETDWTLVIEGEHVTRRSSIRLYAYRQLRELLEAAGFEAVHGLDAETGAPFEFGARRLAVLARRPRG